MSRRGQVVLVTGGTGFVGSHLVEACVAAGHTVRCVVRSTSSTRWLPPEVELVTAAAYGGDALARALDGVSVVYHLAAATSALSDDAYRIANVELTAALTRSVATAAPQARLVLCSSLAAAGPSTDRPVTERDASRPIGPYGRTKLAAEEVVAASGLDHVIVRPPAVYGPRDRDILEAFRLARRGVLPSFAPAEQLLSLIHVRDLAAGLRLAALRGSRGRMYYLADGPPHAWGEIVQAMAAALGRRVRFVRLPLPVGAAAARLSCTFARITRSKPLLTPERITNMSVSWTCDDARARTELAYSASVPLSEGMQETARWYRTEGWL